MNDNAETVMRIGVDGAVTRVPLVTDERGAGRLLREQIGCSYFDVIRLDNGLDMWVDDEAIVAVDINDPAALSELVNPLATLLANILGRPGPVFGAVVLASVKGSRTVGLSDHQLEVMSRVANRWELAMSSTHAGEAEPGVRR